MVFIPHLVVCFWPGSGPSSWRNLTWTWGSAACHSCPQGPSACTLGGGEEKDGVSQSSDSAFGPSGVSQEGKNAVGKTVISPSAPLHDMGRQPDILLTGDQFLGSACV